MAVAPMAMPAPINQFLVFLCMYFPSFKLIHYVLKISKQMQNKEKVFLEN
ncbi:hypothetical protein II941_03070 [bacterium]|nr:hypothetical protein [bacterium]